MGLAHGVTTRWQATKGIVQDGLVLNLDAGVKDSYNGGTTWRDLKGSNNGTLTNGPTFDSERGGSIVVDGTNDLIHVPDSADVSFDAFNNFTVSIWCKLATSQGSWKAIFAYSESSANSFTLQRNSGSSEIRMFRGGNNSVSLGNIFSSIFTGNWINLVLTYDSSSGTVCYVNNSSIATTGAFSIGSLSSPTLRILCERTDLSTQGEIAIFSIYNKTLTATEVSRNYNVMKHRFGV